MTARSIARELAVILFPQLPKDKNKLEQALLTRLVGKAVAMLTDNARQTLADANGLLMKAAEELTETELEHPSNSQSVDELRPVPLTTGELRKQLGLIERALHLVSEALDVPEIAFQSGQSSVKVTCKNCKTASEYVIECAEPTEVKAFIELLLNTYLDNREKVDEFLRQASAKWKIERMVSIDRDILRLACTEAFFLKQVPVNVSISEAVELTHRFADERAAKFINGILADLAEIATDYRKTGIMANLEQTQPMSKLQP